MALSKRQQRICSEDFWRNGDKEEVRELLRNFGRPINIYDANRHKRTKNIGMYEAVVEDNMTTLEKLNLHGGSFAGMAYYNQPLKYMKLKEEEQKDAVQQRRKALAKRWY